MRIRLLKAKIHRATVTRTDLDYVGSILIDANLLDAAGILPYEMVLVANLANGSRHETYAVAGRHGSGEIAVLGAAAHLVSPGDQIIIMAFADLEPTEVPAHKPAIVLVDDRNHILSVQRP